MSEGAPPGSFVWVDCAADAAAVAQLGNSGELPNWLARLLVGRGIRSVDEVKAWLDPRLARLTDPFALPDMQIAVDRVLSAIERQERITVFGDYDVDGLTSVALMLNLLGRANAQVTSFLPHRLEEGYGLSLDALERCLEETRPNLIITVDCGTGSLDSVNEARRRNVDVIITDHHHAGEEIAPALAVVNPRRQPEAAGQELAGVGVAFKFAHALLKEARKRYPDQAWPQFDPRELLDLVALGTVADLVPLRDENRILVRHGLKCLSQTKRAGINALIQVSGIKNDIGVYEVGFLLGPRLNASGRLGTAQTSLKLLMTNNPAEAHAYAQELDAANRERQQVERATVEDLHQRLGESIGDRITIVEDDATWHPGVVGIVASRMVQKYYRPSIVIGADDQGRAKGSCRSISGLNMVEALAACSDLLVKHGGHAMAAGLEIEWDRIPAFKAKFESVVADMLGGQPLQKSLTIDGWLEAADLRGDILDRLDQLKPFGIGHPEPIWACRGMSVASEPREVGTGHLKTAFSLNGITLEAIGFGLFNKPIPEGLLDVAFQLRRDVFRGIEKTVMHIKDFRAAGTIP